MALEHVSSEPEAGPGRRQSHDSKRHAFFSACMTLTLGILGSSILPVPYAFSRTGILVGLLTMLLVALMNNYTSGILVWAAGLTGKYTYEDLAHAAGGKSLKVVAQVSLLLLLFGTLCGDYALLADVGTKALLRAMPQSAPALLVGGGGRGVMVVLAVTIVFPLCLLPRVRQLESAATCGTVLVVALMGILVHAAVSSGFPGVWSGEVPLWRLHFDAKLPEAFSVLGFAFYLQPMLMPLLREMPAGQPGIELTRTALHFVIMGVAMTVYGVVGVFAAATFGLHTLGDVLENQVVDSKWGSVALNAAMTVYLSIAMPPMHFSLRCTLDSLVAGSGAPFSWTRYLTETIGAVFGSLLVALCAPKQSEKMFAITGATAVCLVCYVIPVIIYIQLQRQLACGKATSDTSLQDPLLPHRAPHHQYTIHCNAQEHHAALRLRESSASDMYHDSIEAQHDHSTCVAAQRGMPHGCVVLCMNLWQVFCSYVLPMVVIVIGVVLSLAALWVALVSMCQS